MNVAIFLATNPSLQGGFEPTPGSPPKGRQAAGFSILPKRGNKQAEPTQGSTLWLEQKPQEERSSPLKMYKGKGRDI